MKKLTLSILRRTNFKTVYEKLAVGDIGTNTEIEKLLSLSILFINGGNSDVRQLGYRILVFYSNLKKDYKPLYDIALNEGLIPIVKMIERHEGYQSKIDRSFFGTFYSAFGENYKREGIYLSDQQKELFDFFDEKEEETVSVVAPTSYGKSELIISAIRKSKFGNICIIVPTKALVAQTKRRLIKGGINNFHKIITHPEMFLEGDKNITAVLTQERLLRLLRKYPTLSFDLVFIDEAHNLLEDDDRNILLAATISILEKRNKNIIFKFLTPFLVDSNNLSVKYSHYVPKEFRVTEYIKTERFYICDFRARLKYRMYDQFIDEFFDIDKGNFKDDIDFIIGNKCGKNLVYLNKPFDIERFSHKLITRRGRVHSETIEKACVELSKYMHRDYFLIECLRRGFIYHHGSVPDNVRMYIEHLFSTKQEIDIVITSSTLLEGVNLPVEKMFLLDNKKGRSNLSPSQFKNLIGRVCRFSEVFSQKNGSLEKLEPEIYLIGSEYLSINANLENFIKNSVKIDKKIKDDPSNILLKTVQITDDNLTDKNNADQFIENFEPGVVSDYRSDYVSTKIGKFCFLNNISEIDILLHEQSMQKVADKYDNNSIDSSEGVFNAFLEIFLPFIKEGEKYNNLSRLSYKESRSFYKMFLDWRIENASYSEMINSFLKYWGTLDNSSDSTVYVGRWGDKERDGFRKLWTDIHEKDRQQRINLAIVRIKDEQDFLDNTLIKYIEVMNDLELLAVEFYERIKYGTNNKDKITLIKNGLSNGLSNLLINNYRNYIEIDATLNTVNINSLLIEEMTKNDENDILIYEVKYNTKQL